MAEGFDLRPGQAPLPDWLTDAAEAVWFADRWHWTPDEVDRLPLPLADDMRLAAMAIDRGRARKERREMEAAGQG